jgi:hypothetical protein
MEARPLTPEEQQIHSAIEKILTERSQTREFGVYYPPVSLGGDFHSKCVQRKFVGEGLIMGELQETFDDGSGHHRFWVVNAGRGIRHLLYKIGLVQGKLVYALDRGKVEAFERGEWQQRLDDLARPQPRAQSYAKDYR